MVEFDDVINMQREVIYGERVKILAGADLKLNIADMIEKELEGTLEQGKDIEYWNVMGRTKIMRIKSS